MELFFCTSNITHRWVEKCELSKEIKSWYKKYLYNCLITQLSLAHDILRAKKEDETIKETTQAHVSGY